MSFRFFELPVKANTGIVFVERPCFLSDHIKPPCTNVHAASVGGPASEQAAL